MGGAFSLLFGLLGLGVAAAGSTRGRTSGFIMDSLRMQDDKNHNYNEELQKTISLHSLDELMDMVVPKEIIEPYERREYLNERYNSDEYLEDFIIRELVQKRGFDYKPRYDTIENRFFVNKGSEYAKDYRGTYMEGL